jgi:hypothetical protein
VLVGLFKFHSVALCGGPYPLPCSATFRVRDALHLIEACDSVTHVRGVFQRLLSVAWGKRTLAKLGRKHTTMPFTRRQGTASADQHLRRRFPMRHCPEVLFCEVSRRSVRGMPCSKRGRLREEQEVKCAFAASSLCDRNTFARCTIHVQSVSA